MARGDRMDAAQGIPQEFYTSQAEISEDEELLAHTLPVAELKDALERLKSQFELSAAGPLLSFTEDGAKAVIDWIEVVRKRMKPAGISDALARKIKSYLKEAEKYATKRK